MKFFLKIEITHFCRAGAVTSGGAHDNARPMRGDVVQTISIERQLNWNQVPDIGHTVELGLVEVKVVDVRHKSDGGEAEDAKRVVVARGVLWTQLQPSGELQFCHFVDRLTQDATERFGHSGWSYLLSMPSLLE